MSTIIRSVHNTLSKDITMSHTNIVIPASSTVDLFTLVSDDELLQIQSELAEMVASGSLTVVLSDDASEVRAGGFALPKYTTTQRDALPSPVEGMLIYNTTTHKLNVRVAAAWEAVTSA